MEHNYVPMMMEVCIVVVVIIIILRKCKAECNCVPSRETVKFVI